MLILAYGILAYATRWPQLWVEWLSDVAWAGFSLAAGWRSLVTSKRQTGRQRVAWRLFGLAALSWSAGNFYLMARQFLDPDFPPYPTLANYLFVALAPLFTAGLFQLKPEGGIKPAVTRRLANLSLIACTMALVSVVALLEPLRATALSLEFMVFSLLDPAAFAVAALFGLACWWLLGLEATPRVSGLLVSSITIHAGIDLYYFSATLGRDNDAPIEWIWLLAFALQYLAAVDHDHPSVGAARAPSITARAAGSWTQAIVPSALILVAVASLALFRGNLSPLVLWISLALVALFALLLGVREWSAQRQEALLHRKVAESEARSRRLLTVSPAVVFTCRPDPEVSADFISPNARTEFGLDPADTTLWQDRVHAADQEHERADFSTVLERGASQSRFRLRDWRDEYRWVYRKMVLADGVGGSPPEIVGSLIDVTESKRLEHQLFQSQRMEALGQLAGGISHDFNNLLTTILGHAELGLLAEDAQSETRIGLEAIQVAGRKAATMTKQLLAFSRRQTLQLRPLDVNQAVREFVDVLLRLVPETIEVRVIDRMKGVKAKSDRGHLEQIVMNLVLNARDAMPDGGKLTVEIDVALLDRDPETGQPLDRAGDYAVISVSDTGVGMSDEVQANIFEPFFSTKDRSKGTGLGLAIVHGIVHQHRGHIELESEEGEGTTLRVFLPATGEQVLGDLSSDNPELVGGTERVLIVEDDEAIAALIRQALGSAGYSVEAVTSGDAALERLRAAKERYDVVLTDVVMPGISGSQLAAAMRRERLASKVVYMSGYADDLGLPREISAGEAPLLLKPLRLSHLTRTIRQTLDSPGSLPS